MKKLLSIILAALLFFLAENPAAYASGQNNWSGIRIDNKKTSVFTWVDPFWHQIDDGVTIKNNFKEISNNYNTVVVDQGYGPLFLTADGAYWNGIRFATGSFGKHKAWSGQNLTSGKGVRYQFNKATGFWEHADNGVVTKNNFKEVDNNSGTVIIAQEGCKQVYLTLDGAYYDGIKFASGTFTFTN